MKYYRICLLLAATVIANVVFAQIPTAQFQAFNTTGCAPLTVTFQDSSTNTPTSWFWDFGNGNTSVLQNPVAVYVVPGFYTISLTATNGSGSDTFTAVNLVLVSASTTVNAGNDQNVCGGGIVNLSGTVTGGSTTGLWITLGSGVFSPDDSSLFTNYLPSSADTTAGVVTIILVSTNNGSCPADTDTTIISFTPSTLTLLTDSMDASCAGVCDGSATALLSGGVPPYTYLWPTGQTTSTASNLCAGTYNVTVYDSTGCSLSSSTTVLEPPAITIGMLPIDVSCWGTCDGVGIAFINGGIPPYTMFWDDPGLQTDSVAVGLCANVYTISVTDANGCTNNANTTINEPALLFSSTTQTDASCGNCDGSATVISAGGVAPYTYLWNTIPVQTTFTSTGLCQGAYMVSVTDGNGCVDSGLVNISAVSPVVFNMSIVNSSCSTCDGSATPSPSNGTPPFTYLWSDFTTGTTLDSVCAGTYSLQITDSLGCMADTTFFITNLGGLTGSVITTTDVSCNGGADGSASVTVSGGTPPYTHLWNDPGNQTSSTAINLTPGAYIDVITDSLGCTVSVMATINQPSLLVSTVSATDEGCNGFGNGTATVVVSGGTLPYSFYWSNGDSTQNLTGLSSGTYILTLTDFNGCVNTDSAVIALDSNGLTLNVNAYSPYFCGGYGHAYYSVSGGAAPYTYQWIPQASYSNTWSTYASLLPGTYFLSVQGMAGCADTVVVIISSMCAPNTVTGTVFDDFNSNCTLDVGDYGLDDWIVRADPGPVFANTMSDGTYSMYLDSGSYTISLINSDPGFRTQVCPASPGTYSLSLGSSPSTTSNVDFSVLPANNCPNMSVHFYHTGFSPCFCSWFRVYYQNNGTAIATNAYIEVEFPSDVYPVLTCTNGNWTSTYATQWDSQNGNVYTFNLGDVPPGPENYFYILTETSCNAVLGATKCVIAHIYPDSSCNPIDTMWDKSSVSVEGRCVGDSLACFNITNTGDAVDGNMQGTSEYRIYENNILVSVGTFQLNGQDSVIICWPANSNTIRLEADQRPGHPGNSHPQDNIELCGTPSFTTGQILLVPEDDEDDFIDIVCMPVTSSWDPNDKTVVPEGLTINHYIDSTDNLEYRIRFQNTGTDTAFTVVVRDTISSALDLSTFRPGSASHPYRIEMHEDNIVQFIFDSILLPDSNINEPESHGFVKFKINQKPGNPIGTVIENTVGIYFDFNPPVITNTVFNTIGDIDALTTGVPIVYDKDYTIRVYPNPFSEYTTFELKRMETNLLITFGLYNVLGKQVRPNSIVVDNKLTVYRGNLPDGVYIYKFYTSTGLVAAGKLVVR